jgi:CRISPR/Cas system type I-B associated protein Csh2 (Cas7 group RAMP superfamily)
MTRREKFVAQLAERTGFSNEEATTIKKILSKLFENDESTARPAESMQILNVVWWEHIARQVNIQQRKSTAR